MHSQIHSHTHPPASSTSTTAHSLIDRSNYSVTHQATHKHKLSHSPTHASTRPSTHSLSKPPTYQPIIQLIHLFSPTHTAEVCALPLTPLRTTPKHKLIPFIHPRKHQSLAHYHANTKVLAHYLPAIHTLTDSNPHIFTLSPPPFSPHPTPSPARPQSLNVPARPAAATQVAAVTAEHQKTQTDPIHPSTQTPKFSALSATHSFAD